ncbi:hypothetical protein Focb16_v006021 [Fusarium oxysporum f. sp. cubense]|uniref:Uncharacterized protein n=1 Tax=Fusarium oxysporum f. sp. cubense TaxID=61366 RepID=A0A559LK50_FUSOC|nr:hypothetical protein Focb16_v006021 [Fusarium oxysporum f. sp. cubense]
MATTLSAAEFAALNDDELGHFMTNHRSFDGGYGLPVDGWDKLSKDERDRLASRLKAQGRELAQSITSTSPKLDLDDLDARLQQVSYNKPFSLRSESLNISRSRSPTPPLDPTIHESEAYHELVDEGGRPLYPINPIRDVFQNPENYEELLRPWQVNISPVSPSGIFQKQLQRWRDFRKWQRDNRGIDDDGGGFPAYVDRQRHVIQRDLRPKVAAKLLDEIETDPEFGCGGFYGYAKAVEHRLARHDFTRPFELDEDPEKQDKLTTWIEYLNYECWWLDKYMSDIERLAPKHDELWQELVKKKILRPHETQTFLRTRASPIERANERENADRAVKRAESEAKRIYALTQKDTKRLSIPKARRVTMLRQSTEKLLAAKRRLELIQIRNDRLTQFVRATFDYDEAQRDASRHRILVQWVLDQVALVEAKVKSSQSSRPVFDGRRTKRKRDQDDEFPERQNSKRRRDQEARSLGATRTQSKPCMIVNQEASRGSQSDNLADGSCSYQDSLATTPEGPRRSSRIAARQGVSPAALERTSPSQCHSQGLEQLKADTVRRNLRSSNYSLRSLT